jgi:hypothetical protein
MRIAIMQPYFLPYIGYWQLIAAVDRFVVLDDVNYINRGWINRNLIIVNNTAKWLTLPLKKASQNKLIHEIEIHDDDGWRSRMKKTLTSSYCEAVSFSETFDFMTELLQMAQGNLSMYLGKVISKICERLEIRTEVVPTSRIFEKGELKGQDRIIQICKVIGASDYLNPYGGRALYDPRAFEAEGIQLNFLESPTTADLYGGLGMSKPLSILDTLMHNNSSDIRKAIANFGISK